ncbi:hypothetical protein PYH37_004381 [Sinorhizobium numidicum]|uniref:Uncharacterized protein n=1 Tax=Sinorhizobium numidicum TaxID=680248 RepID=A0ABY8CVW2_9HYPH|nr:hypothetical protein [Sinorhizobium numidicum]WEX76110.1 hypothetical protein PYH37_004381 [Sinorhizobium numidicum]WEX82769.1 hypothetical protein PYH38_005093 [Sinorhizobium numidicum]
MSALTLAINNAATAERRRTGQARGQRTALRGEAAPHTADDGDVVLALLSRARSFIERMATKRQASNVNRNRVESRRQLAKLPVQVRNDLLLPEQPPIRTPDRNGWYGAATDHNV